MAEDLAVGLGIFVIGLLKKVLLADPLQPLAAAGVTAPAALGMWEAWQAALAYFRLHAASGDSPANFRAAFGEDALLQAPGGPLELGEGGRAVDDGVYHRSWSR